MPPTWRNAITFSGGATSSRLGRTGPQGVEDRPHLPACKVRAEAEVLAVAAEREVIVGVALDVEPVGILEHILVAVRRRVPKHHRLTLADRLAAQFDILDGGALELDHDRGPAQNLLDGRRHQRFVVDQHLHLIGMVEQRP